MAGDELTDILAALQAKVSKSQAEKAGKLKVQCEKVLGTIQHLADSISEKHEREVLTKIHEFKTKMDELQEERGLLAQRLKTELDKFHAANDAIGQTIIKSVEKTKKLDAVLQKSANGTVEGLRKDFPTIVASVNPPKVAAAGDRADKEQKPVNQRKRKSDPEDDEFARLIDSISSKKIAA